MGESRLLLEVWSDFGGRGAGWLNPGRKTSVEVKVSVGFLINVSGKYKAILCVFVICMYHLPHFYKKRYKVGYMSLLLIWGDAN